MSLRPIILISITVALAACSKPRIENLTPAVTDGSYTANDGAAIVSAIVITKDLECGRWAGVEQPEEVTVVG